jgi:hypothetical protein
LDVDIHQLQTKVVLRWYAAMATRLGSDDIAKYLESMLIVLIKITEGSAAKAVPGKPSKHLNCITYA